MCVKFSINSDSLLPDLHPCSLSRLRSLIESPVKVLCHQVLPRFDKISYRQGQADKKKLNLTYS